MDENGIVTDTYDYDAFGELRASSSTPTDNAYRFAGQQFDPATGLYSLRARYYDPSHGRFLSRDTYAYNYQNPIELNRYGYGTNNPATYYDPTGHFISLEIGTATQVMGMAAGFVSGGVGGFVTATMILILGALDICGSLGRWVREAKWEEIANFLATSTLQGAALGAIGGVAAAVHPALAVSILGLGLVAGLEAYQKQDAGGKRCFLVSAGAGAVAGGLTYKWWTKSPSVPPVDGDQGKVPPSVSGDEGLIPPDDTVIPPDDVVIPPDDTIINSGDDVIVSSEDGTTVVESNGNTSFDPQEPLTTIPPVDPDVIMVDPKILRFSQNSAGGRGRATPLRESMSSNGWNGDPVDVVITPEGYLVTIDNTRVAIAQELGISKIPVRIHNWSEGLPTSMTGRFGTAQTWGEALIHRTSRQKPPLPPSGTEQRPRLPE